MLTLKPGSGAQDIGQYRDLWLVPHGQKLLMHMLNAEYIGAMGWSVPNSHAGWEPGHSCTEQTLALRLMTEHAALESRDLCVGFQDLSTCFMSILKSIQSEVERQPGVDPAVSQVVEALHHAVQGRFETEHGLSDTFTVDRGTGQGCHNGPARAKLTIAPAQRAVSQRCAGYKVRDGKGGSAPQMYYVDDGCFTTGSLADLQAIFDLIWFLAKLCGLTVKVKGSGSGSGVNPRKNYLHSSKV